MPNRCHFAYADGRRCAMPRLRKDPEFCRNHANLQARRLDPEIVARELVSLSGEFKTASDVNHALAKLWTLLAESRLTRSDAAVFAYIAQLMMQTLPAVRREISDSLGYDAWRSTVDAALDNASIPVAENEQSA